ncbi:MAG: helix-turn-helix domain-containing protein [Corallococcus sp.]|nr:helix-turn-helix domain-containing protein [Corallococcus sp.]MCM1359048.1 helix-turn-helix domain-containing protein [Corallococcus sp.]MCM1395037.1 helix-turn-helix domain-containing protein [Corallococcus sp.]
MENNEDIHKLFGNELKRRREAMNLSQRDFARKCGVSFAYYGRVERGEHSVTLFLIKQIADFLEIRVADFFTDMPI